MCFIYVYFWNRKMDNPVYLNFEILTTTRFLFTISYFWDVKLKSPFRYGSPSCTGFLFPPRAWLLPGMQNFFHQSLTSRGPPHFLHWRNSGADNGRESVYTCCSSECYVHLGWSSDVFGYLPLAMAEGSKTDHLFRFHSTPKCEIPFV